MGSPEDSSTKTDDLFAKCIRDQRRIGISFLRQRGDPTQTSSLSKLNMAETLSVYIVCNMASEAANGMHRPMSRRYRHSGFTLAELLMVIAIMSIVMGIVMSSLGTSGSANLKSAGNTVSDTISLARQNSISQDAFTAIVVQTSGDAAYTSYCLMQLKRNPTTGNFTDSTWQPLAAWRHLGGGVVFDPGANVANSANFFGASGSLMGASANLSYQGKPLNLSNAAVFQVFRPDGSMAETQTMRLRVVRGVWNPASTSVTYQGSSSGGTPSNYYDILFLQDTGQTKIELP